MSPGGIYKQTKFLKLKDLTSSFFSRRTNLSISEDSSKQPA